MPSIAGAAKGAAAAFVGYKLLSKLTGGSRVPSKGRLVLVTGAAQGIGRFMALQFAARGARLVLWDLDGTKLEKTAAEVRSATPGAQVSTYVCDLSKKESIYAVAEQVKANDGHPDVVLNNAGVVSGAYFLDTPDSKNELTMAVNAMAHMYMAKAFLPHMCEVNSGSFASVSSLASIVAAPAMCDYAASKSAARAFAEGLSLELKNLGHTGVRVTCICPAHINTGLFTGFSTGPGSGAFTLEAADVAAATIEAIEVGDELVILPRAFSIVPAFKGAYETITGGLGLAAMSARNPMEAWDPTHANKTFDKMEGKASKL